MDIVVPSDVFWCAYCGEEFSDSIEGQKSMVIHLRDEHPDIWEGDPGLREWAHWEFGVR
jgi:hypothetical protein